MYNTLPVYSALLVLRDETFLDAICLIGYHAQLYTLVTPIFSLLSVQFKCSLHRLHKDETV